MKTLHPDEVRHVGAARDPRQHVPPPLPARRGRDRGARRVARVHRLGRADPHRLRRLPGVLAAGHAARAWTTTASRSARSTTARAERFTPEGVAEIQRAARLRHRHVPGHLPAGRRFARRARAGRAPHARSGRSVRSTRRARRASSASGSRRAAPTRSFAAARSRGSSALPFDGFALGGLAVGESRAEMLDTVGWAAPLLPADAPALLHGARRRGGDPRGDRARDRHVRLRAPDADRAHRLGADRARPPQPPQRAVRPRPAPARGGLRAAPRARGSRARSSGIS